MVKIRKSKIVFIHPDLGIGGAERLVLDVAVAISKENDVMFVTNHFNKNHAFEEIRNNQYPVSVIGDWIPRGVCGIFQAFFSYIRMIYLAIYYVFFMYKNEKPDLFFIDQIPMAVPFIKWAGGKVVYYCHHPDLLASSPGGMLKRLYRLPINWLEMKGTAMADVILVNSKYTAKIFKKTFPEIKNDIQILYPTISSNYQGMIANTHVKIISEIDHIPKETFIFLSINRFHPAKKLELAIDALEAAQNKLSSNEWNNIHLIMAGGYDPDSNINATYFTKLVKLCEEKNLTTKVTFLKSPSDGLKADLLMRCNCLIYTPINEHFGIVPLEAMTAAKPVIACNSGGPCETVLDDITGYLCNPKGDSLADAMSNILKNDKAVRMGFMGKKRLQRYFSYENFVQRVNEVVETNLDFEEPLECLEKIIKGEDGDDLQKESKESQINTITSSSSPQSEHVNARFDTTPELEEKAQNESITENPQTPESSPQQSVSPLKPSIKEVKNESISENPQSPKPSPQKNASPSNSNVTVQKNESTAENPQSPKPSPQKNVSPSNSNVTEEKNESTAENPQSPKPSPQKNISPSKHIKEEEKNGSITENQQSPEFSPQKCFNSSVEEEKNISLEENRKNGANIEIVVSPCSTTSSIDSCTFAELVDDNEPLN